MTSPFSARRRSTPSGRAELPTTSRLEVGVGFPVLIELLTFGGPVTDRLLGDGETTPTRTPTPAEDRVDVGDELLPGTPQTETAREAYVAAEGWTLTVIVDVENPGERTYDLRLRAATTRDGRTVDGGGESGPVPPGGSATVAGSWDLPEGSTPATVDVVAVARDGTATTTEETVRLRNVNVRGGG